MDLIRSGIVWCGNVTEVKSGSGFQKADGSSLVAVMRRERSKPPITPGSPATVPQHAFPPAVAAALRDCNSRKIADNCPAPTGPVKGDRR
jgi:hypothetical protein